MDDLNKLYKKYSTPAKNELRRWGCNGFAFKDIYQDTFIIFLEKLKTEGHETWNPQAYITRICKNKWFKERKRLQISEQLVEFEEFEEFGEPEETGEPIKKQMFYYDEDNKKDHLIELLLKHLKNMSAICQEVLNLYSLGHSEKTISNILNLDPRSVKNKKYYCKEKLQSMVVNDPLFNEIHE